jgi:protein-L-isoaspartate O-methyltransferase
MSRAGSPSDLVAAARAAGIGDERVLAAISVTPRAGFVPGDDLTAAYHEEPNPDQASAGGTWLASCGRSPARIAPTRLSQSSAAL